MVGGRTLTRQNSHSDGRSKEKLISSIRENRCQHQIEELLTELIHVAGRRDRGQFLDPIQIQSSARRLFLGCVTGGCCSGEFIQPRKSLLADLCINQVSCPSHPELRYVNGLHFRLLLTNFLRGAEKSGFGRRRREGKGREGKEGRKEGRKDPRRENMEDIRQIHRRRRRRRRRSLRINV